MRKFFIIFVKELRELLTLQTILPLIIVVVLFLGLGKVIAAQSTKLSSPQPVTVVDNDHSPQSALFIEALRQAKLDIHLQADKTVADLDLPRLQDKAVFIIPRGFGEQVATGRQTAQIDTYTIQRSFSMAGMASSDLVNASLQLANTALSSTLIQQYTSTTNPEAVRNPVQPRQHLVVADRTATVEPALVASYLSSQITLVPVILFMVILLAAQMIATAMANEKENKTLETLLAAPVSRESILAAKMLAAGLMAGLMAIAYLFGMRSYYNGFTAGQTIPDAVKAAVSQLHLTFTPTGYALLGLSLFLAILAALAIALILGSFAQDVKSVQSLITPLMVLLVIPYIATIMLDLQSMPTAFRALIAGIPFSYPFLAPGHLYLHDYNSVLFGLIYQFIFFVVALYIAARIFASEHLLTLRLNFSQTKRKSTND